MSESNHSDGAGAAIQNAAAVLDSLQQAVDVINAEFDHDSLIDLAMSVSENPEALQDDLSETTANALNFSHITRTMTVLNYAISHRDHLNQTALGTVLDAALDCTDVINEHSLERCESGNCNCAAFRTDLTAGWDGTGEEIRVCDQHYRGLHQDNMPVRERDYHTDPSDPDVEGVDEIAAYQQDGMAGVAFVRQSREAWQSDMQ